MVGTGLHTGSLKCIIGNIKAKRMETRITRVFFKYALREEMRATIDEIMRQKPESFDALLSVLREKGWERNE